MVRVGDVMELAMWIDGTETEEQLMAYEKDVIEAFASCEQKDGCRLGIIRSYELNVGDQRVPEVPEHILERVESPSDVKMLVYEAPIVEVGIVTPTSAFVQELEPKDLERLMEITRSAARVRGIVKPWDADLTDEECHAFINEIGPRSALAMLGEEVH